MSRNSRSQHTRPWREISLYTGPDADDREQLDRLLADLPGDDEATHAHDQAEAEAARHQPAWSLT